MGPDSSAFEVNELIRRLELEPHPEGGHFRRTWAHPTTVDDRPLGSAILYLLARGERSHWHRLDAVEMWHHYAGDPLELRMSVDGGAVEAHVLGADITAGHNPQLVVPAGVWQSAVTLGQYTLAGCTVTPGFKFDGFDLAPDGWEPSPAN